MSAVSTISGSAVPVRAAGLTEPDGDVESGDDSDFTIYWRDLGFMVRNGLVSRLFKRLQGLKKVEKKKVILKGISGRIISGQLVAFMGPSGAGKSTLLECVVGKRITGRYGEVGIDCKNLADVKVAFIAQKNSFFGLLTVRESVLYATKLQMATKILEGKAEKALSAEGNPLRIGSSAYYETLADKVIEDLGLEVCAYTRISACSGGQLKRVAIAQELVAKPRIMVLDEPTSGLDSSSCLQVVEVLSALTKLTPKIAVLVTIHQPSYKVLSRFDVVYVMSANGKCIYNDSPEMIVEVLARYNLICPPLYNPSDYLIEIAIGEHGFDRIDVLSNQHEAKFHSEFETFSKGQPLSDLQHQLKFPLVNHVWTLFQRNTLITVRDPLVFGVRFASTIIVAFFMTSVFGTHVGRRGGCPPDFGTDFEPTILDKIGDEIEIELKTIYNNAGNLFFSAVFVLFSAITPTCLAFPTEMSLFITENDNGWYSAKAFFYGKLLAEIPFQVLMIVLYAPLSYTLQNQIPEVWRFCHYIGLLMVTQLIGQTMGYLVGGVFMNNIPASIYVGPALCIPMFLLSGLFIKIKNMNRLFSALSNLSFLRFANSGMFAALYGFNRCGAEVKNKLMEGKEAFEVWLSAMLGVYDEGESVPQENNTDYEPIGKPSEKFVEELVDSISGDFISDDGEVQSAVMNIYGLKDDDLYYSWMALVMYLIVTRILVYVLVVLKSRKKH